MKKIKILILFLAVASVSYAQQSPRVQAQGTADGVKVDVDYSAPSVKGRVIWGGLEDYGKVWRAGANSNTTVFFGSNVKFGDQSVPAGKYSLFIIPNEEGHWVVILNSKTDIWKLRGYSKDNDAARVNITPKYVDSNQEQLKYSIDKAGLNFAWEKVRLSIPITSN